MYGAGRPGICKGIHSRAHNAAASMRRARDAPRSTRFKNGIVERTYFGGNGCFVRATMPTFCMGTYFSLLHTKRSSVRRSAMLEIYHV